jgi:tetratricopeptide (TPR) repeat protein
LAAEFCFGSGSGCFITEEPEFAEALLNLGHALMSLGQEEEARSFWRRAIREKPELAQTYFEPA